MARYMKLAAVTARAPRRSEMCPARMPPTTPPMSNMVERFPAVESDKYWPLMAARFMEEEEFREKGEGKKKKKSLTRQIQPENNVMRATLCEVDIESAKCHGHAKPLSAQLENDSMKEGMWL